MKAGSKRFYRLWCGDNDLPAKKLTTRQRSSSLSVKLKGAPAALAVQAIRSL